MAYPSVYPTSLDSYTAKTDAVDFVMAVDVNELQSAIVAIETMLGTGIGITISKTVAGLARSNFVNPSNDATRRQDIKIGVGSAGTEAIFLGIQPNGATFKSYLDNRSGGTLAIQTTSVDKFLFATNGDFTAVGGLNVGTATGATAGQVRASAGAYLGGVTSHSLSQMSITSLADHGKVQLAAAGEIAIVFVHAQSSADAAIYVLNGGYHTVTEMADPSSKYTPTEDNDTTTNIYYDAGNARYELNNELGGAVTYNVWLMRNG